jgi:serine/threonine protein kinase
VLDVADFELWLDQLSQVLDYAHGQVGIVHRDLQPANILLTADGRIMVRDFGIACCIAETMTRVSTYSAAGTLAYMSPQQYDGDPPTPAGDWYALVGVACRLPRLMVRLGVLGPAVAARVRLLRSPGTRDLFEWAWTSTPTRPIKFSYSLNVSGSVKGDQTLAGVLQARSDGEEVKVIVTPDPLVVPAAPSTHDADIDENNQFSLGELLRVIELYNYREGTRRTGAHHVESGTVDGFATGPGEQSQFCGATDEVVWS